MEPAQAIGVHHFLASADGVARFILASMVLASVTSWYLIITKAAAVIRARQRAARFMAYFWSASSLEAVASHLQQHPPADPLSQMAHEGIVASRHHERLCPPRPESSRPDVHGARGHRRKPAP